MGTSKTIKLFKTFHIRALTLVNDLEPMGTLKRLLHLVIITSYIIMKYRCMVLNQFGFYSK